MGIVLCKFIDLVEVICKENSFIFLEIRQNGKLEDIPRIYINGWGSSCGKR